MSKLYFFYGCMGSSKTAQALMMAYNFREKGKRVAVCMPEIGFREKPGKICSRTGMETDCISIAKEDNLPKEILDERN